MYSRSLFLIFPASQTFLDAILLENRKESFVSCENEGEFKICDLQNPHFICAWICLLLWVEEGIKRKFCREVQSVFLCVSDQSALWEHRLCLILLIFCPEICWTGLGNSNLWSHQWSLEHQLLQILIFYFYTSIKTTVECCDNPSRTGITERFPCI